MISVALNIHSHVEPKRSCVSVRACRVVLEPGNLRESRRTMRMFRFVVVAGWFAQWLLVLWSSCLCLSVVEAQRFLRDGFTSKLDEEFKYEAGLDNVNTPGGMPREMYVLADLKELELTLPAQKKKNAIPMIPDNPQLTRHLRQYLQNPIQLQLDQRKGGIGYRAAGRLPNGKRLRGSWRRTEAPQKLLNADFVKVSYDEAVRSRLLFLEIELLLPRLPVSTNQQRGGWLFSKAKQPATTTTDGEDVTTAVAGRRRGGPIPRVIYQLAVEGGVMNPKAVIPRGDCLVKVAYADPSSNKKNVGDRPTGTIPTTMTTTTSSSATPSLCPPFAAKIGMRTKPGLVDPSWARGRTILRQGRPAGVI